MKREPACLRRGKAFHKSVQADWNGTAEGNINVEHTIDLLPAGSRMRHRRRGRMDLFVDEVGDFVVIVEIKATDWDRILFRNIQKNLASHRRQVWRYIDKHHEGDGLDVCAGIIYPSEPKTPGLKERIEQYLNDNGIQVVWYHD